MKNTIICTLVATALFLNIQSLVAQTLVNLTSSNLPIVVINTNNNAAIVDDPKVAAHMGIISNPNGINTITDKFNIYDGSIGIETRGNSTQNYNKKPYVFETRDALGNNLDVPLLGMPADNDWILLASYLDRTLIRDPLAHYISRSLGEWTSNSRHCELVVNGKYMGVYLLIEKIKRVKNRLNISKLTPEDIAGDNLTGGYIYEVTGFTVYNTIPGDFGQNRVINYPKPDEIKPEQLSYIAKYDNDFRNVMQSATYDDFYVGYEKYINVNSFVNELIVQEAMRNGDAYGWSSYFFKDKNGKLNAGPAWDFDQTSGNSTYRDGAATSGWLSDNIDSFIPVFWQKLINEPRFKYRVKLKWQELRNNKLKTEKINAFIDSCATTLNQAQKRNFTQWPILGVFLWRETAGYELRNTYEKEVAYLKSYMAARMDWMDKELNKVAVVPLNPPTFSPEINEASFRLYPNPATDYLIIDAGSENENISGIQIFSREGVLVQNNTLNNSFDPLSKINLNPSLPSGLYHLRVVTRSNKLYTGNFVVVR